MSADTDNCLFCRIVRGELSATFVYQDSDVVAFQDVNPGAPTHVLIVPRQHIPNAVALDEQTAPIVSRMALAAKAIAISQKADANGYRLVINNGSDAGQSVDHLHMHLLAGRKMAWPPG